jgi:hypothetical protein
MLAAPPPPSDRDEVIGLLRRWHESHPGARRDPTKLAIDSVDASPIHRIAITRIAESRGVSVRPRTPASRKTVASLAPIDPWTIAELDLPEGSRVGTRKEHDLAGEADRVAECERCRGEGKMRCGACHGSGVRGRGMHHHVCGACSGAGHVTCLSCTGLGGFSGPVYAWSAIVEGTHTRIVRAPGISDEAALDVDAALERGLGTVITRDDAWSGAIGGASGYRTTTASTPLGDEIAAAYAELGPTTAGRVRGHRLEIRRASVYTVVLRDGTRFATWGSPPKVSPEDALDAPAVAVARVLVTLSIVALLAVLLTWWMRQP